jgi:histidinol dehydrogenase
VGGAQAIAGMAYGTASIPAVNLICGPGNRFVTLAKKMVYGDVGIDGLYGPTETIIIADDTADAKYCAADLLAQAEHDVFATPILITTSGQMVTAVEAQLQLQLKELSRSDIARASLENNGLIVQVDAISEALEIANIFAPEHLCLLVERPDTYLPQVHNAGAVFLGHRTPEVLGDFVAGPSHVMPTGGTAKFSSPLGVNQFLKVTSTIRFTHTA